MYLQPRTARGLTPNPCAWLCVRPVIRAAPASVPTHSHAAHVLHTHTLPPYTCM